jgi:CRP-like cAMP-binding protein
MSEPVVQASALSGNRLLAVLDPSMRAQVASRVEHVSLRVRDYVYEIDKPIEHVYFPLDGVISMVAPVEGAPESLVETGTVGNEGMVGLPLFLGAESAPGFSFAQVPGDALRMAAANFRELTRDSGPFTRLLHRYTQALFVQIAQSTACNRVHAIQERCARWLLMTHDRVRGDSFELNPQFLGQMLGERRSNVNRVAALMERAGFIRYADGTLTVLDRAGLESASCGCYAVVRDEYDRMLGPMRKRAG